MHLSRYECHLSYPTTLVIFTLNVNCFPQACVRLKSQRTCTWASCALSFNIFLQAGDMAQLIRSAKSGNDWTANERLAYNITVVYRDFARFFDMPTRSPADGTRQCFSLLITAPMLPMTPPTGCSSPWTSLWLPRQRRSLPLTISPTRARLRTERKKFEDKERLASRYMRRD